MSRCIWIQLNLPIYLKIVLPQILPNGYRWVCLFPHLFETYINMQIVNETFIAVSQHDFFKVEIASSVAFPLLVSWFCLIFIRHFWVTFWTTLNFVQQWKRSSPAIAHDCHYNNTRQLHSVRFQTDPLAFGLTEIGPDLCTCFRVTRPCRVMLTKNGKILFSTIIIKTTFVSKNEIIIRKNVIPA